MSYGIHNLTEPCLFLKLAKLDAFLSHRCRASKKYAVQIAKFSICPNRLVEELNVDAILLCRDQSCSCPSRPV